MSRITEIARILGCTGSNVCYLLPKGRIKETRISAGWVVSDQAVQDYLAGPRRLPRPVKNKLHKGQKFRYWTVLDPDTGKNKNDQRTALVQCICGKTKNLLSLICCMDIAGPAVAIGQNIPPRGSKQDEKRARKF